jgi:hypothetical protein
LEKAPIIDPAQQPENATLEPKYYITQMQGLVSICSSIRDRSHESHLQGTCYFGPFVTSKTPGEDGPETDKGASESQKQTPVLRHTLTNARLHQGADEKDTPVFDALIR